MSDNDKPHRLCPSSSAVLSELARDLKSFHFESLHQSLVPSESFSRVFESTARGSLSISSTVEVTVKSSFAKRSSIVLSVVALVACAEKKQLTEMHDSTDRMDKTTKGMADDTNKMRAQTEALKTSTDEMRKATLEMAEITREMGKRTQEMGDRTKEMAARTVEMNGTTKDVRELTKELKAQTGELYDASRQGAALALRRDLLESMYKAESGGKKLAEGAKYFMAFEFQLWTGYGPDQTDEKRLELMASATSEFFKDVKEFQSESLISTDQTIDPLAQHSTWRSIDAANNKRATFNAIAATMHSLNRKQQETIHALGGKQTISMYDMIATSLKDGKKVDAGVMASSELATYERDILVNQDVAIKLLQARHNFLGAILLSQLKDAAGFRAKAMNYLFHSGTAWDIKIDSFSQVQIEQFQSYLKGALKTRKLLRDLGIQPQVDKTLMAFFSGMTMKSSGKGMSSLLAARTGFIELIEQFRVSESVIVKELASVKPSKESVPAASAPSEAKLTEATGLTEKPEDVKATPTPDIEKPVEDVKAISDAELKKSSDEITATSAPEVVEPPEEEKVIPAPTHEPAKKPGFFRRTWSKISNWWHSSKKENPKSAEPGDQEASLGLPGI